MKFDVTNPPSIAIPIGRTGENEFTSHTFDCSAWKVLYPDGLISVSFKRPDGQLYPVVVGSSETLITWAPSSTDLSVNGEGKLELHIQSGDTVGKSATFRTITHESLGVAGDTPAAPDAAWLDSLLAAAAHTATNAQQASSSATAAALSQQNAGASEVAASSSATSASAAAAAAKQSETIAQQAESGALLNKLNGIEEHNSDDASHPTLLDAVTRAESIARGRATAHVFDTKPDMDAWLLVLDNVAQLTIGDNLYIRDIGVKDYWWDGAEAQELEAESPDLTDYYTKGEVNAQLPIIITQTDYDALVAAGTVEAGRIYYVVG